MERTRFLLLCFLLSPTLTTQEWVKLDVRDTVTAECGERVVLHCNASSSVDGLSVMKMEWSRDSARLCSVDSAGVVSTYPNNSLSSFHCGYEDGRLALIFSEVLPLESGDSGHYMCKLHSNRGVPNNYTRVKLKECSGTAEGVLKSHGPSCTFSQVHPDGDVHWFHGSQNLSGGSVTHQTMKSVDGHGWVTVHSNLTVLGDLDRSSLVAYNCSLMGSTSGRYIASTLVLGPRARGRSWSPTNAAGPQGTGRTLLLLLLVLLSTLD